MSRMEIDTLRELLVDMRLAIPTIGYYGGGDVNIYRNYDLWVNTRVISVKFHLFFHKEHVIHISYLESSHLGISMNPDFCHQFFSERNIWRNKF